MSDVQFHINATQDVPMSVQKVLSGITLNAQETDGYKIDKGTLSLEMLSKVISVSQDSLYEIAKRMGYEGSEEDFVQFLMTESKDGFINIDDRYPRQSGYYTLDTAIVQVASDGTLSNKQKSGMIITFFDGTSWCVFQYNKTYERPSDFLNPENWSSLKSDGGGVITVQNYSSLPATGNPKAIYYLSDSELYYAYRSGVWKLMTHTWENIKVIQGDVMVS